MQLLLDHLGATIIAGTVLLMVGTLQLNAQQTALEEAAYYRGKARTLNFAETISREFRKIGEGTSGGSLVEHTDADGQTVEFAYKIQGGGSPGGAQTIRYSLVQDTTIHITRWDEQEQTQTVEDVPIYRLQRSRGSGSARTVMSDIKHWNVKLLDTAGNPTASLADTRQLQVRLRCLFSLGTGQSRVLSRTIWGTTVQPTGLRL